MVHLALTTGMLLDPAGYVVVAVLLYLLRRTPYAPLWCALIAAVLLESFVAGIAETYTWGAFIGYRFTAHLLQALAFSAIGRLVSRLRKPADEPLHEEP